MPRPRPWGCPRIVAEPLLSRVTIAKIALALVGVAVFLAGVRLESEPLRWTGIALAAVAWLLRFVEKGQRRRRDVPPA